MKTLPCLLWLALLGLLAAGLVLTGGCDDDDAADDDDAGDDDAGDDDDDDDDAGDDDDVPPPPGCDTLHQGWNDGFFVDGLERGFYLDLPDGVEDSWPWPVVFNWHGYGDTATNMRHLIDYLVNYEGFPFIGVTPEDTGLLFDWDVFEPAEPQNREVRLFDELVEELNRCWGVDRDRIHMTGFSFGGGVADMLGVMRGDQIASIGTYSGVYASNPANAVVYAMSDWPDLATANLYPELRIHGGAQDWMVLPFGQYAENDRLYLNERGHEVVICNHNHAHNMGPMYMEPETIVEFFRDHSLGTHDSPYAAGFPGDYPEFCEFSPAWF